GQSSAGGAQAQAGDAEDALRSGHGVSGGCVERRRRLKALVREFPRGELEPPDDPEKASSLMRRASAVDLEPPTMLAGLAKSSSGARERIAARAPRTTPAASA